MSSLNCCDGLAANHNSTWTATRIVTHSQWSYYDCTIEMVQSLLVIPFDNNKRRPPGDITTERIVRMIKLYGGAYLIQTVLDKLHRTWWIGPHQLSKDIMVLGVLVGKDNLVRVCTYVELGFNSVSKQQRNWCGKSCRQWHESGIALSQQTNRLTRF